MRIMTVALLILFAGGPAAAQLQKTMPQSRPAAKPAIRPATKPGIKPSTQKPSADAKSSPRDSTPAERGSAQFDLAWTAEYVGLMDGELNERTTAAIKAFQRARKL